ncbi:MAG: UDP-4-amino-4,6-dideoxy-N-acetyl-beta-L-altrosamine transaminase [Lachnospiraceae bacterium]|nr:UDP-4-amino-4,6-dideoxy-N-acetyl-beta-L-altrosamine transaminase [Lachnospiraceae bacterium]MBQ2100412.1 UDP-4-amino-4,6-dideoxy-N-acetyl-beta-L-altrosamine transaminase [Lachnospiraceae bacterium]MBQ3905783.1 UDP-4-amino-4,6-dideoxy-N-acetyl-beta-L-altrosamine transaminase [Lachnospiraceae bacterium]
MEELAIFGGKPVREKKIFYGRQCIEQDDVDAVVATLTGDLITCGPKVQAAEKLLCEVTGAKYAVLVSNGTAALHLAAMAAGFGPGDEVIVSSITFAASANCIRYCGATPVFADIEDDTYNIDPESIKRLITPRTKGIVAVDFTGQAVKLDEIRKICKDHGLLLIEDAAHAIGTKYKGQPVGSIADMTCFSFHPVKTVTCGEGGAITTNNERLYRHLMRLRTHGITRNQSEMAHPTDALWYNEQVELGFNYRLTDFQAALLISQLGKLSRFSQKRKEIAAKYDAAFSQMPELQVQREIPESDTTRHLYILRLNLDKLNCDRRQFFDALYAENTCPQVHYLPVYWHSYYEKLGYEKGICMNAEAFYMSSMSIPLYPTLTDEETDDVIRAVKKIVAYYRK